MASECNKLQYEGIEIELSDFQSFVLPKMPH